MADPTKVKWGQDWVDLHIMTTNVTQGRPQELPFIKDFFFAEEDMRKLFPDTVVDWLKKTGGGRKDIEYRDAARRHDPVLIPMPAPGDLPVVVAARMSFGFPLVLSAVPLWSVDRTSKNNGGLPGRPAELDTGGAEFERNWFSDGGDCANMPVHMFDNPIPRWPSFGLNLRETLHPLGDQPQDWTFLPDECHPEGSYSPWQRPEDGKLGSSPRQPARGLRRVSSSRTGSSPICRRRPQ